MENLMKITTVIIAILIAFASAFAEEAVVTTLLSDGSTNSWTQTDLVSALQLMNRKYHRDVQTATGRAAWHGKIVKTEIAQDLTRKTTYEDGTVFVDKPVKVRDIALAQMQSLLAQTNGVPARLAAARAKIAAETGATSNVTVVVNAARASAPTAEEIAAAEKVAATALEEKRKAEAASATNEVEAAEMTTNEEK